jgi:hypothetical protein
MVIVGTPAHNNLSFSSATKNLVLASEDHSKILPPYSHSKQIFASFPPKKKKKSAQKFLSAPTFPLKNPDIFFPECKTIYEDNTAFFAN